MKKNLLLVEDTEDTAIGLSDVLSDEYNVTWERTFMGAIKAIRNDVNYYAAILDFHLNPGDGDGLMLATDVRLFAPDTKIFIYSALTDESSIRKRVVDMGCKFIRKPISGAKLKEIIAS